MKVSYLISYCVHIYKTVSSPVSHHQLLLPYTILSNQEKNKICICFILSNTHKPHSKPCRSVSGALLPLTRVAYANRLRLSPITHRPSPIAHRPSPIAHRPSPIAHRPTRSIFCFKISNFPPNLFLAPLLAPGPYKRGRQVACSYLSINTHALTGCIFCAVLNLVLRI